MNRGKRRESLVWEWDDVKQQNPNFAEDMEIIEKLSSIGLINAMPINEIKEGIMKYENDDKRKGNK